MLYKYFLLVFLFLFMGCMVVQSKEKKIVKERLREKKTITVGDPFLIFS